MENSDQNKWKITELPKKNVKESRQRLNTLLDLDPNLANAHPQNENDKKKNSLQRSFSVSFLDTRFVTVRRRENSRCNFKVLHDIDGDKENVAISGKATASTLPRGDRVKNIKKSLRRPHSRELQGIAPVPKRLSFTAEAPVQKSSYEYVNPRPDTTSCDFIYEIYGVDVLTYLLEEEEQTPMPTFLKSIKRRAFVLNWLTDTTGGGDPAVIQTATWYLDTVMRHRQVESNDLPIAIMACYWIATKIHGKTCKAQSLVQKTFDEKHLCSVERKILLLLNFPRQPVLPQEFIGYFVWCCDNEQSKEMLLCATFICVNANNLMLDMCDEYPSVVAVAAIKTTLLLLKKQHLVNKLKACFVYQTAMLKGQVIEVCISQIEALRMFFTDQFEFTAAKKILDSHSYVLEELKQELNYLYSTGGEGIIRAFLMN